MWIALFKRYWDITIFKESPANTPHSLMLLMIVAFLFFMMILVQWYIVGAYRQFTFGNALLVATNLLFVYSLYTYVLLKIKGKLNRGIQTLTALLASHLFIHALAIPLLLLDPWLVELNKTSSALSLVGLIYLVVTFGLTIWQFLVTAFIYKHALEIDSLTSILASLGLVLSNLLMVLLW